MAIFTPINEWFAIFNRFCSVVHFLTFREKDRDATLTHDDILYVVIGKQ